MYDITVQSYGVESEHFRKQLSVYLLDYINTGKSTLLMIDEASGKELWSHSLVSESLKLASSLQAQNIKPDEVVGLICDNRVEFMIVSLAVILVGAVATSFNPLSTKPELQHLFGISKPCIIFTAGICAKNVAELQEELPFIRMVIDIDTKLDQYSVGQSNVVYSLQSIYVAGSQYTHVDRKPDDLVLISYSSGTTGLPKGVGLTNRNIVHILEVTRLGFVPTVVGDYTLTTIPSFSSYGLLVSFLSIVIKFGLVVMKSYDDEIFFSYIQKYKVKFLYMIPSLMYRFLDSPLVDSYDLSSLKSVISGGSTLNQDVIERIKVRLNLDEVYLGYGMTELSVSGIQCPPCSINKPGSCGYLLPSMQCKVVDVETGKSLGPNCVGELCFQGPLVMKGYYENEEATNSVIDSKGWFHSGDIGHYDEDYVFYVTDRQKDVIKSNSYQISPTQLECIISRLEGVKDVAVIGIPDEQAGELPKAFVVKLPEANITEDDVIRHVADNVSPQKRLTGGVMFVNAIPKLGSGKILRHVLRKQYA